MLSLKLYRYLLIVAILIMFILIGMTFKKEMYLPLKIGTMWILVLLILNFYNMFSTLNYYDSNKNKQGPKGPKGDRGTRGNRGGSMECSQCGEAGKIKKDIFATNVNDFNIIVNNDKLKIGKCMFPFVHDNEMIYSPTTKPRVEGEINDAAKNGWCATSLNLDKTYKTYGYANMAQQEEERREREKMRSKKRADYLKSNTGILDLRLIVGNRSSIECPSGYTKIDKDLNEASGGKYLYLCKKEGLGGVGIKEIRTVGLSDNLTCPSGFRRLPYDLNKDSGGEKMYLCTKKSRSNFVTDIQVQNDPSCLENYDRVTDNLNKGSGGNEVYICSTNDPVSRIIAVDTVFLWGKDKKLYFFKGDKYYMYDDKKEKMAFGYPKNITDFWGEIPANLNAAFTYGFNNKTYFFKGALVWEYNEKLQKIAPGYPKYIKDVWKGIPNDIDSVFTWGKDGKTYFFKGKFYYKYDDRNKRVERGYPKMIERRWENAPHNINAVFTHNDGKTYFIRADKFWVVGGSDAILSGYPRDINSKFPGLF